MAEEKQIKTVILKDLKDNDDNIKLIEIFEKYSYYQKWIWVSIIVAVLLAFVYLRYTSDKYHVSTTIFINDTNNGGLTTEQTVFEDLGVFSNIAEGSVFNEIIILKSYTLSESVIKDLGINITYHLKSIWNRSSN